ARGEVFVEAEMLGQKAHPCTRPAIPEGSAQDAALTCRRPDQTEQHLHTGGLAGTVGSQEAKHLAAAHLEPKIRDGGVTAELLAQCQRLDRQCGHRRHCMDCAMCSSSSLPTLPTRANTSSPEDHSSAACGARRVTLSISKPP